MAANLAVNREGGRGVGGPMGRAAGGQAEREGLVSRNVAALSQPPRL